MTGNGQIQFCDSFAVFGAHPVRFKVKISAQMQIDFWIQDNIVLRDTVVIFQLELSSQMQRLIKKDFMRCFPTQAFARSGVKFFDERCDIVVRTQGDIKRFG